MGLIGLVFLYGLFDKVAQDSMVLEEFALNHGGRVFARRSRRARRTVGSDTAAIARGSRRWAGAIRRPGRRWGAVHARRV